MKRKGIFIVSLLVLISLSFVSCVNGGLNLETAMKSFFTLRVTEFTLGPALKNAVVTVFNQQGEVMTVATTDEKGEAVVEVFWDKKLGTETLVDVSIIKKNHSPSRIENLKLTGNVDAAVDNGVVEAMAYMARIDDEMPIPDFDIRFFDLSGEPADLTDLSLGDTLVASITCDDYYLAAYAGINFLPGYLGGSVGEDGGPFSQTINSSEFQIDVIGATGTACLNLVLYDTNYGRVNYKYELNIDDGGFSFSDRAAPTGVQYVMRTSDNVIDYWLSESRGTDDSKNDFVEIVASRGAPDKCITYMRASFTHTTETTGIMGYNLYRSSNGIDYDLASFWMYPYSFAYDPGIGLNPGQKYWYKIETVYVDGSVSDDANVVEIVPFDIFKVEHITPVDASDNVGRRPNLSWKPIGLDGGLADVSYGMLPEASITYYYMPAIVDRFSEEWLYYTNITPAGYVQFVTTEGAVPISIGFLSEDLNWVTFTGLNFADFTNFQSEGLEAYKSYQWGHLVAAAQYEGEDNDNDGEPDVIIMSITADKFGFFDRYENDPEEYHYFTTGQDY